MQMQLTLPLVRVGTSSWAYEGWQVRVEGPERMSGESVMVTSVRLPNNFLNGL